MATDNPTKNLGKYAKKGNIPWNKGKKGIMPVSWTKGKPRPKSTRDKIRKTLKLKGIKPLYRYNKTGKEHWHWKGGVINNPYPKEFTPKLKLKIRTRDNFICCLCGKTEREELEELNRVLCVNHIDFNKNNCNEKNLNTLCLRCNVKINREREYWTNYFNSKYER